MKPALLVFAPTLITEPPVLSQQQAEEVCLIGAGERVCKYLGACAAGWVCLKVSAPMRAFVDQQAATMNAKGDNCGGFMQ